MGLKPNDIAKQFGKSFGDVAESCLMIGIAKGILYILQMGKIVDTIVYGSSIPSPRFLQFLAVLQCLFSKHY